jgi:cyclic beta-1,2-glucan synthetase
MPAPASLLGNGRHAVLVRATGTGFSAWDGLALTSWSADPTIDGGGLVVYLRDPLADRLWSVGSAPAGGAADRYACATHAGTTTIAREDDGIASELVTWVAADADVELRRLTLRNVGGVARALEVSTYAEIVLHDPASHAGHPAFSKLFVETEAADGLLLAHRRPRADGDRTPWLAHALVGPGAVEWDTDRARVLARGHDLRRPRALATSARLAGTTGSVLDPVFCLRRRIDLAPGADVALLILLAAGWSRDAVLATAGRVVATGAANAPRPATDADADALPPTLRAAADVSFEPRTTACGAGRAPAPIPTAEPAFEGRFDGDEYVIRVEGAHRPPMPWSNVVANPTVGCIASETGAGCTWSRNSREHRLTPWANDPIVDPHGEAVWLRDDETGACWSAAPGPTPAGAPYEARHGFGYSRWLCEHDGLAHELVLFVPSDDPVRVLALRVENRSGRPRRLSLTSYAELVLGTTRVALETECTGALCLARNAEGGDFADGVAFAAVVAPDGAALSATTDRAAFVGRGRTLDAPAALDGAATSLDGRAGSGLDACFATRAGTTIPPGGTIACAFLLGETTDATAVRRLADAYRVPGAVDAALARVREGWRALVSAVRIETPSPAIDRLANGWLLYQTVACRMWGRSALYQSGGAFGFRDQLQDSAALVHVRPDLTRAQILLHAGHQFVEGDVLHWWHPPHDRGTRTRFADDLLWLPYVTAFYVGATGDAAILDEEAPFVTARALAAGEDEAYLRTEPSGERASLYAHCCRAIDRSLAVGAHGLPLMGTGDWNDGMNRVGREGRGESVWMGWFLADLLGAFAPLCAARKDRERAARYRAHRARLRSALERTGWDGAWYRRAYYDDGTPLGSAASDECRIDALAQAWAVISGVARRDRAVQAMESATRLLVDEDAGIIRLLTPPFDRTPHDPGYIKGYVPGIRENGGQYTHAALWMVRAAADLGWRDRAVRWLEMLTGVSHTRTPADVARYQVEPYVVAADIYGVAPHVGRGGWTWYTGSAAWMYRVILESILGVTIERGRRLRIAPRVPDGWPRFRVSLRLPGEATTYDVTVENPTGRAEAVVAVRVDERAGTVQGGIAHVVLRHDGRTHHVTATLGPAPPAC